MLSGFYLCWVLIQEKVNALGRYAGKVATSKTGIQWFESGIKLKISTGP
jgi:hypothetical protein